MSPLPSRGGSDNFPLLNAGFVHLCLLPSTSHLPQSHLTSVAPPPHARTMVYLGLKFYLLFCHLSALFSTLLTEFTFTSLPVLPVTDMYQCGRALWTLTRVVMSSGTCASHLTAYPSAIGDTLPNTLWSKIKMPPFTESRLVWLKTKAGSWPYLALKAFAYQPLT